MTSSESNRHFTLYLPLETPTTEDYVEVGADAKITCKVTNSKHDGHVAFEMNNRVIAQLPTQEGGGFFFIWINLTNYFYNKI